MLIINHFLRHGEIYAVIFLERIDLMAQYTNAAVQTVALNANVLFTDTPVKSCKPCVVHRDGSGIVTLRGITNQCKARFKVIYNANIAIPTGGTVSAISTAIALDGEALSAITATETPTAIGAFNNVSGTAIIEVPKGCCYTVSVKNVSTQAISVSNASLVVERVS